MEAMDTPDPPTPEGHDPRPEQKTGSFELVIGLHFLALPLLIVLALLHWGLKALFAPEERQTFVQQSVSYEVAEKTLQRMAEVVTGSLDAHAYPTPSSTRVAVLGPGTQVRVLPQDERAPRGWTQVALPEGGLAWVDLRGLGAAREDVVTTPERRQRTEQKPVTEKAVAFGKPSMLELLRGVYPHWLTTLAALLALFALLVFRLEGISWVPSLLCTALLAALCHGTIQTVNFLVMHIWGH